MKIIEKYIIMEIVHTNLCGPFKTVIFNGDKYFIFYFIDDYSKIARVYTIKSKAKAYEREYVNECWFPI